MCTQKYFIYMLFKLKFIYAQIYFIYIYQLKELCRKIKINATAILKSNFIYKKDLLRHIMHINSSVELLYSWFELFYILYILQHGHLLN